MVSSGFRAGGADEMKHVIRHASELTRAFRLQGLPVALVSILGDAPGRTEVSPPADFIPQDGWAEPVDDLDPQPTDMRVVRNRWSAFGGTSLHADLQQAGVTQVVLAGVATSIQRGARHRRDDGP